MIPSLLHRAFGILGLLVCTSAALDIEEVTAAIQATHKKDQRELIHTVPPLVTPQGCTYDHQHNFPVLVDQIFCPSFCGPGRNFSLIVTSKCNSDGTSCPTFADCRLTGCNDDCGSGVGDCPCEITGFFDLVCSTIVCTGPSPEPTAAPTPKPIHPIFSCVYTGECK